MKNNYIFIGENLKTLNSKQFNGIIKQVDTIYIDPPYNTKHVFSYEDDKEHLKWLNDLEERISASYNKLKDTGILFISIDDNEYAYLKVVCDKIYGRNNFIGSFITHQSQRSNSKQINIAHEYILCYAKNKKKAPIFKVKRIEIPEDKNMIDDITLRVKQTFNSYGKIDAQRVLNNLIKNYMDKRDIDWIKNYNSIDDEGNVYFGKDLSTPSNPNAIDIPEIGLHLDPLPTRGWSSPEKFKDLYRTNRLVYKAGRPYEKHLLIDSEDNACSLLNFYSRQGTNDLNKLGLRDLFDTPKPVELIKYLIRISTPKDGIIMDFYGGSGTTAQAVYELNKEKDLNFSYCLIQMKENIDIKSKPYKKCFEIGIEPEISRIMLYRINTYLNLNSKEIDYKIINID